MQFHREARFPGGAEDLAALDRRENSRLTEDIAALREPFTGDGGNHLIAHELHVRRAIVPIFGWYFMRAEECRHQCRRKLARQATDHAKLLQFRFQLEPVT